MTFVAEKLKALAEAPYPRRVPSVMSALPQIVAVIEAAESAERKAMVHGGNGTLVDIARSLHPALSALDEALGT
jgi:hypothetical protein